MQGHHFSLPGTTWLGTTSPASGCPGVEHGLEGAQPSLGHERVVVEQDDVVAGSRASSMPWLTANENPRLASLSTTRARPSRASPAR